MKNFWKALGIAALAAAVPVRIKKDEENRKKTYQSLLLSVDVDTDESGKTSAIGINIGDGVISSAITNLVDARKEAELFADDEPEAAVLDVGEANILAAEPRDADGETQAGADGTEEADPDPEF